MEKDANILKPIINSYLDNLYKILEIQEDDVNELRRIYAQLQSDRSILSSIEGKLNEQINFRTSLNAKSGEIAEVLSKAIRERK